MKWLKNRARFYLSCNYSCTLYLLVKIKEVKLKNLHTSACLNLNYGTTKQKPKMWRLQRWWNLSKVITNTLASLILVIFQLHNSPPFLLGEKYFFINHCSDEIDNFLLPGGSFSWGHKQKCTDLIFDTQMYLLVILGLWIWNFSATMVRYTSLRKNSRNILERWSP